MRIRLHKARNIYVPQKDCRVNEDGLVEKLNEMFRYNTKYGTDDEKLIDPLAIFYEIRQYS